jgi:hypothetical protein
MRSSAEVNTRGVPCRRRDKPTQFAPAPRRSGPLLPLTIEGFAAAATPVVLMDKSEVTEPSDDRAIRLD